MYERHGLIKPKRTGKDWRLYGANEMTRLNEVLALKTLGLSEPRREFRRLLGLSYAAMAGCSSAA